MLLALPALLDGGTQRHSGDGDAIPVQFIADEEATSQPTTRVDYGDLTETEYPQPPLGELPAELNSPGIRIQIDKIHDGTMGNDEDGWYALLENVDKVDPAKTLEVTRDALMKNPMTYRGQYVRMRMKFFDMQVEETNRPTTRMEKIYAIVGQVPNPIPGKPMELVVVHSLKPYDDLEINDNIEVVGYFYKVQSYHEKRGVGRIDMPVIVAKTVTKVSSGGGFGNFNISAGTVAILVILLVVYMVVRVKLGRASQTGTSYRPRRYEMTDDDIEKSRHVVPPDELADEPLDGDDQSKGSSQ